MLATPQVNRRQLLRLGGAAAVAGLLPGCSDGRTPGKVTVTYGSPGGEAEDKAWLPVFEAFNREHPDIQANYMAVGGNYGPRYMQKLQTLIAADRAPDLFFLPEEYVARYVESGTVAPLGERLRAAGVDTGDFWQPSIDALTYQDRLWGLPRDGAPMAMWYNADLFDQAGVPYPDETWTWETHLDAAKELTRRDRDGRAIHLGAGRGDWVNWVWQAGGRVFSDDGTRCLLDQPEALEGLRFAQDLVLKHEVAPSARDLGTGSSSVGGELTSQLFQGGRLATWITTRGALGGICEAPFRFSAAPAPAGKQRIVRSQAGPTVLWSGSRHADAAFELLRFICSAEGQRLKISEGFAFPSRKELTRQDWFAEYRCGEAVDFGINTAFTTVYEQGWARTYPPNPSWPEVLNEIDRAMDELWLGQQPADRVGADVAATVNTILARGT